MYTYVWADERQDLLIFNNLLNDLSEVAKHRTYEHCDQKILLLSNLAI